MPTLLLFLDVLLLGPQGQRPAAAPKLSLAEVMDTAVPPGRSDMMARLGSQLAAQQLDESEVEVVNVGNLTEVPHGSRSRFAHPGVSCPILVVTRQGMDLAFVMPAQRVPDHIVRDDVSPCLP